MCHEVACFLKISFILKRLHSNDVDFYLSRIEVFYLYETNILSKLLFFRLNRNAQQWYLRNCNIRLPILSYLKFLKYFIDTTRTLNLLYVRYIHLFIVIHFLTELHNYTQLFARIYTFLDVWDPPRLLATGSCCWVVWGLRSLNAAFVDLVYHILVNYISYIIQQRYLEYIQFWLKSFQFYRQQ
jgi:hypothetical protein